MKIESVRYYYNQGYPTMAATIDGQSATFITECKPGPYAAGLVFLGSDFEEVVPPINLEVDGRTTILQGFSRDPKLFELYRQFKESTPEEFQEMVDQS